MTQGDDFDFTRFGTPAPPPAQKVEAAREEATSVGPQLEKRGFFVAMARHAGAPVAPREGERHAILVIEDDEALWRLVAEVLSASGFFVRGARNRTEINAEINRPPLPDLVLLDVSLPDADGFQILERIRGNAKLAQLPVILMTGRSGVEDVARGLALDADGYVTKPFKISALLAAVNTVLGLG